MKGTVVSQFAALHFMYYNFGRVHKTLRVTPAMEAGISDHIWTLEEIASLSSYGWNWRQLCWSYRTPNVAYHG